MSGSWKISLCLTRIRSGRCGIKTVSFPADESLETIGPFIETLVKHGYVGTTLHLARHSLTAFYLFLAVHALGYHPDIMWSWFSEVSREMGSYQLHWRRILKCRPRNTYLLGEITADRKYSYTQSSLEVLPSWCRRAVEVFLEQKRRELPGRNNHQKVSVFLYPFLPLSGRPWL